MHGPISEDDLHAWTDDRLDATRRAAVEQWLTEDPARGERLTAWRASHEQLRAAYGAVVNEPVPASLRAMVAQNRRPAAARAAAMVAWVTLGTLTGAAVGYRLGQTPATSSDALAALPRQAAIAHAVFSPEIKHPVEVGADQEPHLVAWLTKRLGAAVRIPDLSGHGFALLGGRLLPATDGPSAQFMYEDDGGRRLTLYLSVRAGETSPATAFRYAQENDVGVFYWIDGRFAYALSGQLGRDTLLPLANAVYHQIQP